MAYLSDKNPVLIFGASGFIGGSLARHLNATGVETLTPPLRECDLLNAEQVSRYIFSLNVPVQVAFCAGIVVQKGNTFETMIKNIQMVQSLCDAAKNARIRSIVYLSSTCVYDYSSQSITEYTRPAPYNYYGISKLVGEQLLAMLPRIPVTVLRIPGVYGVGDQQRSVVGIFFNQLIRNGYAEVFGDGRNLRDYVTVEDLCRLIERFLSCPCGEMFNVATGHSLSIKEIIFELGEALGVPPKIVFRKEDKFLNQNLIYDTTRLRERVPDFRFTDIRDGIANYVRNLQCAKMT